MNIKSFLPDIDIWNILSDSLDEFANTITLLIGKRAEAQGHKITSIKIINSPHLGDEILCFCSKCPFEITIAINSELEFSGEEVNTICPKETIIK